MRTSHLYHVVPLAAVLMVGCFDGGKDRSPTTSPVPALTPQASVSMTMAGDPLPGLTDGQLARFEAGRAVFETEFEPANGLGPLFNQVSCLECHENPAVGGGGDEVEVHESHFNPTTRVCRDLVGEGGPVVQQHATPALTAALGIDKEPVAEHASGVGMRTSNDLFGLGLVDAIPEATIIALEDPNDANGDGISGRAHYTADGHVGRFGRKATDPTLAGFIAGAFLQEIGITNPQKPNENNIGGQPIPDGVDPAPDPEIPNDALNRTIAFVRFLAPPPRGPQTLETVLGGQVFRTIGCADCHIPTLVTGASDIEALDYKEVHAFTDLLLHKMGPDLADICRGNALPGEFRTEPLSGIRFNTVFLHDGRATTAGQAIMLHAGEARGARNRFEALPAPLQAALLAYLNTL
jgi:CxxC motif-containing protein (DUF1111 family)